MAGFSIPRNEPMKLLESKLIIQFDNMVNVKTINNKLISYVRPLQSQFGLGVFYMLFAGINSVLIERGTSGGVAELADALNINAYYIIAFAYLMSVYCFLRDRLPIHYAVGSLPIIIYGVFVAIETIQGDIQMTGLLAALYLLTIPYLVIIGVVNRYLLKQANKEIKQIREQIIELRADG